MPGSDKTCVRSGLDDNVVSTGYLSYVCACVCKCINGVGEINEGSALLISYILFYFLPNSCF